MHAYSLPKQLEDEINLVRTDADLRLVTDLWFVNQHRCIELYGHIACWDVSSVTNMGRMFRNRRHFNEDLSAWDVSSVTNMSYMFHSAAAFNQDLSI